MGAGRQTTAYWTKRQLPVSGPIAVDAAGEANRSGFRGETKAFGCSAGRVGLSDGRWRGGDCRKEVTETVARTPRAGNRSLAGNSQRSRARSCPIFRFEITAPHSDEKRGRPHPLNAHFKEYAGNPLCKSIYPQSTNGDLLLLRITEIPIWVGSQPFPVANRLPSSVIGPSADNLWISMKCCPHLHQQSARSLSPRGEQ